MFEASRSLTALDQNSTIVAVIEMSQVKWLVAGLVPGLERQPLKKLDADAEAVLKLLQRWRSEAARAGHTIRRIVAAYGPAATASGWRAGSAHAASRPTSSMP
ncbi:hypothetical protein [Mesorhizobium sp. M0800]|uniref:hypothetical protein n=1 Tax=Mesorhizobium sp. M0800 TaxID=2957000 RepID=UPI003336790F